MSLDGFIARPDDTPGKIFDWFFNGKTKSKYYSDSLPFKLAKEDAKIFDEGVGSLGAMIAGRRTYDFTNGWNGNFFNPIPFFVLTHKAPSQIPKGRTRFTFVTDGIQSAVRQAKAAANGKKVGVMGANTAQQCIETRLLDELYVHIAPYLLGDGVRLFQHLGGQSVELKRVNVIDSSSGWTHIFFKVVKA
jgi:dihydrofolate reductase